MNVNTVIITQVILIDLSALQLKKHLNSEVSDLVIFKTFLNVEKNKSAIKIHNTINMLGINFSIIENALETMDSISCNGISFPYAEVKTSTYSSFDENNTSSKDFWLITPEILRFKSVLIIYTTVKIEIVLNSDNLMLYDIPNEIPHNKTGRAAVSDKIKSPENSEKTVITLRQTIPTK